MTEKLRAMTSIWSNPVVVRDMRVRLRGPRAFWNQALYLGVLSLIALAGYAAAISASGSAVDPIQIQQSLATFYFFIFLTVAGLILLIAPALTAASVVFERQRLTLDLLVTSPMTSLQMLTGKLVSSVAFLLLLLSLSIPASALCVMLGGATIGDVFRIYVLLATDGIVLAAIGLLFSCTTKNSVQAISGTYGAVILFAILTFVIGQTVEVSGVASHMRGAGAAPAPPLSALVALNPFIAVTLTNFNVILIGASVPLWLVTAVFAVLIVRLLMTASALRLGLYEQGLVGSLRRQALLITAATAFPTGQWVATTTGLPSDLSVFFSVIGIGVGAFCVGSFFFPSLFVPVVDEEAPVLATIKHSYNLRAAFSKDHAGALPFFHIWLLVTLVAAALGVALPEGTVASYVSMGMPHMGVPAKVTLIVLAIAVLTSFTYLSAAGYLLWCIARRAATFCPSYTMARPITYVIFVFIVAAPFAVMAVASQLRNDFTDVFSSPFNVLWLGFPFSDMAMNGRPWVERISPFAWTSALAYALGTLIYSPWLPVTPGIAAFARRKVPA